MVDRSKPEADLIICISNELNEIKGRLEALEELSSNFRRNMRTELVNTITGRFEKTERTVEELNIVIESLKIEIEKCKADRDFADNLNKKLEDVDKKFGEMEEAIEELGRKIEDCNMEGLRIKRLINEVKLGIDSRVKQIEQRLIEEKEMEDALKKLAGSEKFKVNRKLLEELRK